MSRALNPESRTITRQRFDQIDKSAQRILCASSQSAVDEFGEDCIPQRTAVAARALTQRIERAPADAARRGVDGALEGGVIVTIGDQAQIGEGVLDFGAVEEAQAAVHAIVDSVLTELFLEVA